MRPVQLSPPGVAQALAVQAALFALLLAWPASWWWRGSALAALCVVLALLLVRRHRRPAWVWVATALAHRRRARRPDDPTVRRAREPAAGLTVEVHTDRAGTRFGLLRDDRSWTAVLALEPLGGEEEDDPAPASLDLDLLLSAVGDERCSSVHVVLRVLPAPSPRVDPRSALATSYRDVATGTVAQRSLLLCLRLEPARCARAVALRGGGDLGARRALAAAVARCAATLEGRVQVRVLGPDDVRAELRADSGAGTGPVRETWDGVDCGPDGVQVCYSVDRWGGDPTAVLTGLCSVPGVFTVLSMTVDRDDDRNHVPPARLRVLCLPEDRPVVDAAVRRVVGAAGGRVTRNDGEHLLALAAPVPAAPPDPRHPGLVARRPGRRAGPAGDLVLPLDPGGLCLGRAEDGSPRLLPLFRDRGSAATAVLDPRVVLVLAFRALALGARVSVVSTRGDQWLPLRRLGVDDDDIVSLSSPETLRLSPAVPRPDRPHLVVVDVPADVTVPPVPERPWQAVLTVVPNASMRELPAARARGPVLLRRSSRREAVTAAPFLGLPPGSDRTLTTLADDQVALVEDGRLVVVDLSLTVAEGQLVVASTGAPLGSAAVAAGPGVEPHDRPEDREQ